MRILLIDDEKHLADALAHILRQKGYLTDVVYDAETALRYVMEATYDLIVLDQLLPKMNGLQFLQEIRSHSIHTPVLMVTARDAISDRVAGLDAGADDYLVKPFDTEELLARIRSLTRRSHTAIVNEPEIHTPDMIFYPLRCEIIHQGESTHLTPTESQLLELLLRNTNNVVTKEVILERIWGYEADISNANVDLYIHYLRKKLPVNKIRTIRSIGYFWEESNV